MTPVIQSVHEPAVRMAIKTIGYVIDYYLAHLPEQDTRADDNLEEARFHLDTARGHLREWAHRSDLEVHEGMKT